MLGDGHRVQAGHVGDPHPFAGGRIKVDVVDPDSELLDEPEAPRPDSPAAQWRSHRDDHVNGRPGINQPRFEPALADDLDHNAISNAGRPVQGHL
jgi:hypothetical protein